MATSGARQVSVGGKSDVGVFDGEGECVGVEGGPVDMMSNENHDRPATSLLHGDENSRGGAVAPAIVQASTFAAELVSRGVSRHRHQEGFSNTSYVRYGNPNHTQVAEASWQLLKAPNGPW